jgi:hypothetical protein
MTPEERTAAILVVLCEHFLPYGPGLDRWRVYLEATLPVHFHAVEIAAYRRGLAEGYHRAGTAQPRGKYE